MSSSISTAVHPAGRTRQQGSAPLVFLYAGPTFKQMVTSRWSEEPVSFEVLVMMGGRDICKCVVELVVRELHAVTSGTQIRVYDVEATAMVGSLPFKKDERIVFRYDTFERHAETFALEC